MENIVANVVGRVRRERMGGRDYLVAPVSMIVPGVLDGSAGPLYYPIEEIGKDPSIWNHVPIVVYHPTVNGKATSARTPEVLEKSGIGVVMRAEANGKLKAEGWFDLEALGRVDNRIKDALENGQPIELSTGLGVTKIEAEPGANFEGKPYTHIATNYRPDHLAVLPDERGACSISDGCGVLVNASSEEPNMGKEKLVNDLVANCSCWAEGDKEVLNGLSEEKLKTLVEAAEAGAKLKAEHETATNALKAKDEEIAIYKADIDSLKVINENKQKEAEVVNENAERAKPQTAEEWLAAAPPEIRSAVANAQRIEAAEKETIISKLVANVGEENKEGATARLQALPLDALRDLAPLAVEPPKPKPDYTGAGIVGNANPKDDFDKDAILPLPVINWAEAN